VAVRALDERIPPKAREWYLELDAQGDITYSCRIEGEGPTPKPEKGSGLILVREVL
jgi:hypothetical protein